jgi:hypothetical protein
MAAATQNRSVGSDKSYVEQVYWEGLRQAEPTAT